MNTHRSMVAARELCRAALALLEGDDGSDDRAAGTVLVSQKTVLPVFGIPPRNFLEDLSSGRFDGEIIKRGKLRLVAVSAYHEFLRKSGATRQVAKDGAESVLAELGLRVVGGKQS